jgi:hypothetical protein
MAPVLASFHCLGYVTAWACSSPVLIHRTTLPRSRVTALMDRVQPRPCDTIVCHCTILSKSRPQTLGTAPYSIVLSRCTVPYFICATIVLQLACSSAPFSASMPQLAAFSSHACPVMYAVPQYLFAGCPCTAYGLAWPQVFPVVRTLHRLSRY